MIRFYIYLLTLQLIAGSALPFHAVMKGWGDGARTCADVVGNHERTVDAPLQDMPEPGSRPATRVEIAPDTDSLDFGQVIVGLRYDIRLTFIKNGGGRVIVTLAPLQGTGAAQFTVPSGDLTLDSSQQAVPITLSFTPRTPGTFVTFLDISSDDSLTRSIRLTGRALPGSRLLTSDIVDFDTVDLSNGPCFQIPDTLINTSGVTIDGVMSVADQPFSLLPANPDTVTLRSGESRPYAVRFCPPDTGMFSSTLTFVTNLGVRTVTLRGRAIRSTTVDSLTITNTDIDFGEVFPDSCATRSTKLINRGTGVLHLTRLASLPAGVTAIIHMSDTIPVADTILVTIGPGDTATIDYTWCPPVTANLDATDILRDVGGIATARIHLHGTMSGSYLEMIDSLPFTAATGDCITRTFTVRNKGSRQVTLSWTLNDSLFSFDPLSIPPNGRDILPGESIDVSITFCADSVGMVELLSRLSYLIAGDSVRRFDSIYLIGNGAKGRLRPLRASRTVLNFGEVAYGACQRDSFALSNPNDTILLLVQDSIIPLGSLPPAFTIISPTKMPLAIPAKQTFTVVIEYCPVPGRADSALWVGRDALDSLLNISLFGATRDVPKPTGISVWLDSNLFAKVGTPFRMKLWVDAAQGDAGIWDSARIVYNPRSFFPMGVFSGQDYNGSVGLRREDDSTIVVGRVDSGGARITRGSLFEVELMGLTTGSRTNSIRIDTVYFSGVNGAPKMADGFVILSGCDLNSALAISTKSRILALIYDSYEGGTLVYNAPEGGVPRLSVIDLQGRELRSELLPVGTGVTQSAPIDFRDLSPGLYLVELRIGGDRTTAQIMITK